MQFSLMEKDFEDAKRDHNEALGPRPSLICFCSTSPKGMNRISARVELGMREPIETLLQRAYGQVLGYLEALFSWRSKRIHVRSVRR